MDEEKVGAAAASGRLMSFAGVYMGIWVYGYLVRKKMARDKKKQGMCWLVLCRIKKDRGAISSRDRRIEDSRCKEERLVGIAAYIGGRGSECLGRGCKLLVYAYVIRKERGEYPAAEGKLVGCGWCYNSTN